jgi:hypothetical protein
VERDLFFSEVSGITYTRTVGGDPMKKTLAAAVAALSLASCADESGSPGGVTTQVTTNEIQATGAIHAAQQEATRAWTSRDLWRKRYYRLRAKYTQATGTNP